MQFQNNVLQQSAQAYQIPSGKMRQNQSVNKISQSMDAKQMQKTSDNSKVTPISRNNVSNIVYSKATGNKKQLLTDIKRNDSSVDVKNRKYAISTKNLGKLRTNRNDGAYRGSDIENSRVEKSILKLVDKQINKGLKAIKR